MRCHAARLHLQPDEALMRYAKIEPSRFGDDCRVGAQAAYDVLDADRGELFVGNSSDDNVPSQVKCGGFTAGDHDSGEARLHVVRPTSMESVAFDARRPGLAHATSADDVHVRVEHQR